MSRRSTAVPAVTIEAAYLGWLPVDSAGASAEPVARVLDELLNRQFVNGAARSHQSLRLRRHRLEISVGAGCLRVAEFDDNRRSDGRQALVPFSDIDWVGIHPRDSRAFGIVLNGYNEDSNSFVHVHAWRCKVTGDQAVANFASSLAAAAAAADASQQQELQKQQQQKPFDKFCLHKHATNGEREGSQILDGQGQPPPPATSQQQPSPNLGSLAHSLAHELRHRLDTCSDGGAPLLHPPRDYDTLHRSHGNARLRCSELPLARSSQAPNGAYIRRQSVVRISEFDEPAPDYDCDQFDGADELNRSSAGSSATPSPLTSGGDSNGMRGAAMDDEDEANNGARWADPWLGFSAWRY